MRPLFLCSSALAIALAAAPAAPAATVPFHGKAWKKGSKIRVYSALGARYDKATNAAIANYARSRTGANVQFVRVKRRRQAQVVLRRMNDVRLPPGITNSQGYAGGRVITVRLNLRLAGFDRDVSGYTEKGTTYPPNAYAATMLIAHELGHVIGLDHTAASTCSIANPGFFRACKDRGEDDFWGNDGPRTFSCDFVQQVDARVLVVRYGGRVRPITGRTVCRMDDGTQYVRPPAPSPQALGATATDVAGANPVLRWTPPEGAELFITRYQSRCSAVAEGQPSVGVSGPGGTNLDVRAGAVEDSDVILGDDGEPISQPVDVCYEFTAVYGKSRGNHTVPTLVEMTYVP